MVGREVNTELYNIYVSSENKLQKFTSSGGLMNYVGQVGSEEGELRPHAYGVTVYNNQMNVCDTGNNQVFDLDLKFFRFFCSSGKEKLHAPYDIKFDRTGCMYIYC